MSDQTGAAYTESETSIVQLQFAALFLEEGYLAHAKNLASASFDILKTTKVVSKQDLLDWQQKSKRNYMNTEEEARTLKKMAKN